jgi:hypothetical protein
MRRASGGKLNLLGVHTSPWGANAMKFALRAALLGASIILAARPASAGTVTVTYTGTFCVSCSGYVNTGSIEGVNAAD